MMADDSLIVSDDCLSFADVTDSTGDGTDLVESNACVLDAAEDDGTDICQIDVFGDEEVYLCGEVGYWKDSGWDSQLMNARELVREGMMKMKQQEETKAHPSGRIGVDMDRPGVPEEYDRQDHNMGTDDALLADEMETAEIRAFGHVLHRPIDYSCALINSATGIPTWFESSGIKLEEPLREKEKEGVLRPLFT